MSKRVSYFGSTSGVYNPVTDTRGLQWYMNQNVATSSSWLDQSVNAYDIAQGTVLLQPAISALSVDYLSGDYQQKVISNVYSGDSSGILFFSGYFVSGVLNIIASSADTAINTKYLYFFVSQTGEFSANIHNGTTSTSIRSTNTITNGSYYYGYIESIDTAYEISLNGVVETINLVAGSNNGNWFADVPNRDNLVTGKLKRTSVAGGTAKANKIIYSNATLSAGEKLAINNFMSVPSN